MHQIVKKRKIYSIRKKSQYSQPHSNRLNKAQWCPLLWKSGISNKPNFFLIIAVSFTRTPFQICKQLQYRINNTVTQTITNSTTFHFIKYKWMTYNSIRYRGINTFGPILSRIDTFLLIRYRYQILEQRQNRNFLLYTYTRGYYMYILSDNNHRVIAFPN